MPGIPVSGIAIHFKFQINMKNHTTTTPAQLAYNECVQAAYYSILNYAKRQLAAIERIELRYSLIREDDCILHEMVNPLLYLRLEVHSYGLYSIHYGIETFDGATEYSGSPLLL